MEDEHKKATQPFEYRALAWVAIIGIVVCVYLWAQKQSYEHCVAVEKAQGFGGSYRTIPLGHPENCR